MGVYFRDDSEAGTATVHSVPRAAGAPKEYTDDPAYGVRLVAAVVGILVFVVAWNLSMILIYSRVPPPFTWIPGFGILFVAGAMAAFARNLTLDGMNVDPETTPFPKPLKWIVWGAIAVLAVVAAWALYIALMTSTPLVEWQGDYPLLVVS